MVTIYNTTLSATSQRYFSDGLGGGLRCGGAFPIDASDPDVGPRAGWPPHKDIEEM